MEVLGDCLPYPNDKLKTISHYLGGISVIRHHQRLEMFISDDTYLITSLICSKCVLDNVIG